MIQKEIPLGCFFSQISSFGRLYHIQELGETEEIEKYRFALFDKFVPSVVNKIYLSSVSVKTVHSCVLCVKFLEWDTEVPGVDNKLAWQ